MHDGAKNFDYLNWCQIKTKRAMTQKQVYWRSAISNLKVPCTFTLQIDKDTCTAGSILERTKCSKNGLSNINMYNNNFNMHDIF